jgi:hypothetical protein
VRLSLSLALYECGRSERRGQRWPSIVGCSATSVPWGMYSVKGGIVVASIDVLHQFGLRISSTSPHVVVDEIGHRGRHCLPLTE